jgi:hypothetical protein
MMKYPIHVPFKMDKDTIIEGDHKLIYSNKALNEIMENQAEVLELQLKNLKLKNKINKLKMDIAAEKIRNPNDESDKLFKFRESMTDDEYEKFIASYTASHTSLDVQDISAQVSLGEVACLQEAAGVDVELEQMDNNSPRLPKNIEERYHQLSNA